MKLPAKRLALVCTAALFGAIRMSFIEAVAEGLCTVLDAYPELADNLRWRRYRRRMMVAQRRPENVASELN